MEKQKLQRNKFYMKQANDWKHLVTRRLAVQVAIAWNYGLGPLFNKRYRTGIYNTLVYYNGKKTDYFVSKKELKQFNKDLDGFLDNPKVVKQLIPEAKKFIEDTYKFIKKLIKDSDKLSDKELSKLYSKFSNYHTNYYTRMWMVFRICKRIVLKIESMLKENVKEFSRIFSTPSEPNDVTNERIDLLKIAISKKKYLLPKHTEKYKHIPMFDFDHKPYTLKHFSNELRAIKNPSKELNKIEKSFLDRKKDFNKVIKELKPSTKLLNLIKMLKKAVYLRDYRDMIRQKLNLSIRDFYYVIGSRLGLSVEETALLTNKEIEEHLLNSAKFSKKEIAKRKKSFLLIQFNDYIKLYSGSDAKNYAKKIKLYKNFKEIKTIKGIAASPGIKKGIAKIVHTNLDLDKIKKNNIMVSAMTRQDFVSVMRKTNAVITDEGGLTCHAAIIARELGLPCVVGTKKATSIIKDGDLISVDGNKGIVKIMKKKIS